MKKSKSRIVINNKLDGASDARLAQLVAHLISDPKSDVVRYWDDYYIDDFIISYNTPDLGQFVCLYRRLKSGTRSFTFISNF